MPPTVPYATVRPDRSLDLLSQREMASLASADADVHRLFRRCALAVLNTDAASDDVGEVYHRFSDFEIKLLAESRGLKLELFNAPAQAFVDGKLIKGIRNHLFTTLRDIVYVHHKVEKEKRFELDSGAGITDAVFRILRNAGVVTSRVKPRLVVCWGGHAISRQEYVFCKEVGYQMGLRGLDIATGCGPGAMKAPMKGAAIAHAKQLGEHHRYVGITEPGIIAAESPNPIVNELVILPDIEKRLEAFVRLAHGIVVFPGGPGTAEEIFYALGIKMHPVNADRPLPLILACSEASRGYFEMIDRFLRDALGDEVAQHYRIISDDAEAVARAVKDGLRDVRRQRIQTQESFCFNWGLHIPEEFQLPFEPTHAHMATLQLHRRQPAAGLVAELRKAFSGIVAGNVKESGVRAVAEHGPFQLNGDVEVIAGLERLLEAFVSQGRMKLDSASYRPCFELAGQVA